jgi:hypothetical protein
MKRVFILLAAVIFSSSPLRAQSLAGFELIYNIPVYVNGDTLTNAWAGGINFPLWNEIDLNGDNIHDLLMYDRGRNGTYFDRISTFINDGTQSAHPFQYAPQYIAKFPVLPPGNWMFTFDYNCDGKMDLFTLDSARNGIACYRNDYDTGNGLHFTLVIDGMKELFNTAVQDIYSSQAKLPWFIDEDHDGDMDIISFNNATDGRVGFHKNYSVEDGFGCDSLRFRFETSCWGEIEFCFGSNDVCNFGVQCRTRGGNHPGDYEQSEFAKRDDTLSSIFAFDNNGDDKTDLLIGDSGNPTSLLITNTSIAGKDSMISTDPSFPSYDSPIDVEIFVRHAYIDVDNDGIKDLLASSGDQKSDHNIWFYKNTNTTSSPVFTYQKNNFLQEEMIDIGDEAGPVFFDENADGLLDIIAGNNFYSGSGIWNAGLSLFRNTGTATAPAFELVTNQYENITTSVLGPNGGYPFFPSFGDMDNDGDKDLMLGTSSGKLYYFTNTGTGIHPASFQLTLPQYFNIDVGNASTPQIVDMDRDGAPDLIVGNSIGRIRYFRNTGTAAAAQFTSAATDSTFGDIDVRTFSSTNGYAVPHVFSDSIEYKMLVSCMHGDVYLYDHIDGNLTGTFTRADTLVSRTQGERLEYNLNATTGDINNDGLIDMIVGLYSGGFQMYYGSRTVGIAEHEKLKPSFDVFPNPARDEINIRVNNLQGKNKIILRMFDATGRVAFAKIISENKIKVDLREFSSGIYMIQLISDDGTQASKKISVIHQ